jgi:hypothetical protein
MRTSAKAKIATKALWIATGNASFATLDSRWGGVDADVLKKFMAAPQFMQRNIVPKWNK